MKSIKFLIIISFCVLTISCEHNAFLDRTPKDEITEVSYWKTTRDLELFLNPFYELFPGWPGHGGGPFWVDNNSDNMIPGVYNARLAGVRALPQSGGGWEWGNIRNINVFHANYQKVAETLGGTNEEINHFIGEGYFFRAYLYFDLLQRFGGVPWYDKPLSTDDEALYAPRESRSQTADRVLAELDKAIELLKTNAPEFRVNRYIALALKSRVALYEGSWEKYHAGTAFSADNTDPEKYFQQAAESALEIMNAGVYQIPGSSVDDYVSLFNQNDLSGNPEIMFWKKYMVGINAHNGQRYLGIIGGATGVSKSLVESYLCSDGKPIARSSLYQGDANLTDELKNRDPRLDALVFKPGDPINEDIDFAKAPIHLGGEANTTSGYQLQKGALPSKQLQQADFGSTTAAIIFRYAEVLLNYAEAKAELGEISQQDLNKSINLLRNRVRMPDLQLDNITPDPNWDYPSLSPIINEIRRERRVELACEGYRLNDLMRWRAHEVFVNKRLKGAKFIQANYPGFNVNVDDQGNLDYYQDILPNGFEFNSERDYLDPIPVGQLLVNDQLDQNPGWSGR